VPDLIRSLFHVIAPSIAEDPTDILPRGPVSPSSIDAIIVSHIHFDHIGDCAKFPDADLIAGPGSKALIGEGWPANPKSPFSIAPVQHPKYHELSFETDTWAPLGPFPQAYDFFGDGSFYLVSTPGHMAGHLGAIALTGLNEWVFMGGDCCHHRSLLVGDRPMSVTSGPMGRCFHADPEAAKETLAKIQILDKSGEVFVALAHDSFLVGTMPEYPNPLNGWSDSVWKKKLDTALSDYYKS
jgi:glyoxylase-like metal-dependent hydrolase (beta-lactamase superfamily II)